MVRLGLVGGGSLVAPEGLWVNERDTDLTFLCRFYSLRFMYKSNILGQSVQRGWGQSSWIDCPAGSSSADGEGGQGVTGQGGEAQHNPRGRRFQDSCQCHFTSVHRSFELLVSPRKVIEFLHQERWMWQKKTTKLSLK